MEAVSDTWLSTRQAYALAVVGLVGEGLLLAFLDPRPAVVVLGLLVAMIYGVYLGFALMRGDVRDVAIESGFVVLGVGLAVLGLLVDPSWIGIALILHGVWDLLHHRARHVVGVRGVPRWYIPFCAAFDIPAGVLAFLLL